MHARAPLSAPIRFPAMMLLALALHASLAGADTLRGRVVRVADGDTITVLDEGRAQHRARHHAPFTIDGRPGALKTAMPNAGSSRHTPGGGIEAITE